MTDSSDNDDGIRLCAELVDGKTTVEQVRQSLLERVSGSVEDQLWTLWLMIINAAQRTTGAQQEPLLLLLRSFRQVDVVKEARKQNMWGNSWTDEELPIFGACMRESIEISSSNEESYVNFCSFAAQLTTSHTADFLLYGLWTVREAVEDCTADEIAAQSSAITLAGACAWLQFGGKELFRQSKDNHIFPDRTGLPGKATAGALPEDIRSLSEQRWHMWKDRLNEASRSTAFANNETKRWIDEALRYMSEAEQL